MTDKLKPALTQEEWAAGMWIFGDDDGSVLLTTWKKPAPGDVERPHAVAALLLHGQPFGFTREDVAFLESISPDEHGFVRGWTGGDHAHMAYLAARIAALLPPEGA